MMELSEFGRRHRSVVVPLAAVPILAAAAGAGWALTWPAEYRHTVAVQIPAPSDAASAALLEQQVSTFRTLVGSPGVAAAVSRETGVRPSRVHDGLATQRPQQGTQRGVVVQITYTGTDRARTPAVTRSAALAALGDLMRPAADAAKRTAEDAGTDAESARRALLAMSEKYGGLPTEEYRSLQNQIAQLEADRDAPSGNRSPDAVRAAIKARKARLTVLAPRVIEAESLQDRLAQANRRLSDARQATRDAEARRSSAEASLTPSSPRAHALSRTPVILRATAFSAGTGLLLAGAVVVIAPRRRPAPVSAPQAPAPARL